MKKLTKSIIYILIAIVAVVGLTTSRANAQSALSSSSIGSVIQNNKNILIASISDIKCEIDELRPNPDNPNTYYSCTPFGPVLMQCPSNLVFDVEANRCEYDIRNQEPITKSDTQTSQTTTD